MLKDGRSLDVFLGVPPAPITYPVVNQHSGNGLFIVDLPIRYSLVGGKPTPLKNMSSSVGMMKFPTEWKVIIH